MTFLSPYADRFEKRANQFLRQFSKGSQVSRAVLHQLIQEDLLRLSLWMEYKYKGYKKLRKWVRKRLYKRADELRDEFREFLVKHRGQLQKKQVRLNLPDALKKDPKMLTLLATMAFLKPGEHFSYRKGAALEKMLQKPRKGLPEADCNQLTTMYIALFATQHPVTDLNIKLLPEHVCIHYNGIDVETTSGNLADYKDYTSIGPVEEILATNLLDVPDPKGRRYKPSAQNLIQSANLAFQFSSHRKTVEKNLKIAYHNLTIQFLKNHSFKAALQAAKKSSQPDLEKHVVQSEAWYYLKKNNLARAERLFRRVDDKEGLKACVQQELNLNLDKIKNCKTLADYKKHKSTIKKVLELSKKTKSHRVEEFARKILKEI